MILWGKMPDGTWIRITGGTAAHCRRERQARSPSTYWLDLSILKQDSPAPTF